MIRPPAWVPPNEGLYFDGPRPTVRGEPLPRGEVDIGAVEVVDSDTVLLGSRWGPIIDEASADGSSVRLLGPHGDPDARVTTDPVVGAIVSLVRLDDDRVVFVAESDDGYQLHLLDGEAVEPLGREGADRNPVAAPDAQSYPAHHPSDPLPVGARWDRRAMAPLAPGPDGKVVTVGAGEDRVPEISLVDIDTGDVTVLARLDGVEATIEEPVVATIVDDDLVFTAEGSLWRLPRRHASRGVDARQRDRSNNPAAMGTGGRTRLPQVPPGEP